MTAPNIPSRRPLFTAFVVAGIAIACMAVLPLPVGAGGPGSIQTTDAGCEKNLNHYEAGNQVYLTGSNFGQQAGQTLTVTVTGQPGAANSGTSFSTTVQVGNNGSFCAAVYQIQTVDYGEYSVTAGGKTDNFRVGTGSSSVSTVATPTSSSIASPTATSSSSSVVVTPTPSSTSAPGGAAATVTPTPRGTGSSDSHEPTPTSSPSGQLTTGIVPQSSPSASSGQAQASAVSQSPATEVLNLAAANDRQLESAARTDVQALPVAGQGGGRGGFAVELFMLGLLLMSAGVAGIRVAR